MKPGGGVKPGVTAATLAVGTANGRVRVVEAGGRKYRVVFKNVDDVARFDALSRQREVSVSVNEAGRMKILYHRVAGKRVVIGVEDVVPL